MPMTVNEIKAAERTLKVDQVNWEAKKSQLERLIVHHNTTLDELAAKLERLSAQVQGKTVEIEGLTHQYRRLVHEVAMTEQQLVYATDKSRKAQGILADLEAVIEAKRQRIDDELSKWADGRRAEYQHRLKADEEATTTTRENLASLTNELEIRREELEQVRSDMAMARLQHQQALDEGESALRELANRQTPLEGQIQGLEADLIQKTRQRDITVAETTKARQEFQQFIDYEDRARKVLVTKDRELQDKAQELAKEDRHLMARRSYLADL